MRKFVIASHGMLAKGIQSTLELFAGKDLNVTYMAAYVDGEEKIETQIANFFADLADDDQAIIFTDIYGGSVNQKFTLAAQGRPNVALIAGFNLPLVIEITVSGDSIKLEDLKKQIASGREAMQLVDLHNGTTDTTPQEAATNTVAAPSPAIVADDTPTGQLPAVLRVDERLIHGQIAMVWSRALNLDGIIVANDTVAADKTQQMALKMAVPSGIKVLIRSVDEVAQVLHDPRAKNKHLLVLVRTVADAFRLAKQVDGFEYINIGNVGKSVDGQKKTLTQFVMLTPGELASLEELVKLYPQTALQNLPSDKKILAQDKIKNQEA
ncbi:PTS sugar transporter subunit IIB [Lacticaseibacillus paracasei]|uniref:PTS system sorbose subfamily IIB component n=1 Tax=Lacticaseibacillus paracasei NRIC 0644 TaxID=1435038 RepID=A0A0C9PQQ4_LACPA|nr:PTS mannose/fructose/sorbose transporter subunit IIAB [Lacticaseibacillus paracasei]EKP96554.1 PTS system sorbose subfamily IIB component [Lacticaseibacillus paracasei]WBS98885.1 PTS sugar transporter subunit IIB [Lacticaseibacillus paracasei]GAN37306.1 PTS system sorbose subfamily IIB component [Lacticaseibacillus paracasei NRIC 0644]